MNHGSRKAVATILDDLSANTLQILLASLGLATIITTSASVFNAIKWVGVAYLIYLGISKLLSKAGTNNLLEEKREKSLFKPYSEVFLMSASNPKATAVIAAFCPLPIDQRRPFAPQVIALGTRITHNVFLDLANFDCCQGITRRQRLSVAHAV